jgi:predicted methyltransferase
MNVGSVGFSRRSVCLASAAFALDACRRKSSSPAPLPAQVPVADGQTPGTVAWAVAGGWRSQAERARDPWRHPEQSLAFWGLKPGMSVVEVWPGAGWYTAVIAPYLAATHGKLYVAQFQTDASSDPAMAQLIDAYHKRLDADPAVFGHPIFTTFGPTSGPVAPAASADLVLFIRNLPYWMAAGIADKAFHDAFAALKPGGVLGIEENRAAPGGVQDVLAADGYVQEAYVKRLAQEAGFKFDGSSEINANPKDTKAYPFGVWTLPPTRQSAAKGKPEDSHFDHAKYDAIGESDRMTLRFVKPT